MPHFLDSCTIECGTAEQQEHTIMKTSRAFVPIFIAFAAILFLTWAYQSHQQQCPRCLHFQTLTPAVIKHYITGFGPWALLVFVCFYAINTISLLPPIGIMSLAAGFIFGPLKGAAALMLGAFLGTTATFFISRFFGKKFVDYIIKDKGKGFQEKLNKNGFKVIFFVRLIPVLPWEVVNYVSGISQITYRDYILATLIGILPSVIIVTFFSDRISHFNLKDPTLLVAVGAFILLGAVPAIYLRAKRHGR